MQISTLENTSLQQLTETFNHAFSDYLTPLHLTEAALAAKIKSENIQLHLSAGCFDGEKLVAFVLHGFDVLNDGPTVYNGGTGVRPGYRGQRLTQQLYDYLLPQLCAQGIYRHQLEVIENNIKAIKVYERIGFKKVRRLDCYNGSIINRATPPIQPEPVTDEELISLQSMGNITPTWQNSAAAIRRGREQHQLIGIKEGEHWIAYAAFAPAAGRIKQLAVAAAHRQHGLGSQLLTYMQQHSHTGELSIINVDANDAAAKSFLMKNGLTPFLQQLEMKGILTH